MSSTLFLTHYSMCVAFRCCYYENQRPQDHCSGLQLWKDGVHWSKKVRFWLGVTARPNCYDCGPSTTCHSEDLSRLAARKYARIIQKLGFQVSVGHPSIILP